MLKEFKTIDEQIGLLKSRGLVIKDEQTAKLYLLTNNYYNIINGYGEFFPKCGEQYTDGTSFEEIWRLYLFEMEAKQAIFQAIIAMERHLKAVFAYRFAEAYPDKPYAYLSIESYDKRSTLDVVKTISSLSRTIQQQTRVRPSSIEHYVQKYQSVPIWVLVNHIDFGQLRSMLSYAPTKIQNAVARDMLHFVNQYFAVPCKETFTPEIMSSFIANINDVRNVCAHNNRLLRYKCRRDSKYWRPLHEKYGVQPDSNRSTIFSVFLSLQCFLTISEYGTMHNKIRKLAHRLDTRVRTLSAEDVLAELGFPNGWLASAPKISY